jgi:hypothetical protein
VWFLPTLETVTDEAVNGIMKAKLAEIIANHLQHLKENPTRRYTPGSMSVLDFVGDDMLTLH